MMGGFPGTKATLAATPVLGLLAVRDLYDKPQTLQAGRVWQRASPMGKPQTALRRNL